VHILWIPREKNEETDEFVKDARKRLELAASLRDWKNAPPTMVSFLAVKEACAIASRRIEAEKTAELERRAGSGPDTLCILKHLTGFVVNPVTRARGALGRFREIIYNKVRMNRIFHPCGEDGEICTGCGVATPNLVHYYGCDRLSELRGHLEIGSLSTRVSDHVHFFEQLAGRMGVDIGWRPAGRVEVKSE